MRNQMADKQASLSPYEEIEELRKKLEKQKKSNRDHECKILNFAIRFSIGTQMLPFCQ